MRARQFQITGIGTRRPCGVPMVSPSQCTNNNQYGGPQAWRCSLITLASLGLASLRVRLALAPIDPGHEPHAVERYATTGSAEGCSASASVTCAHLAARKVSAKICVKCEVMHGIAMRPAWPSESGKKERTVMAIGNVFCEPMITTDFLMSSGNRSTVAAEKLKTR